MYETFRKLVFSDDNRTSRNPLGISQKIKDSLLFFKTLFKKPFKTSFKTSFNNTIKTFFKTFLCPWLLP
jgi:hypothetical protein